MLHKATENAKVCDFSAKLSKILKNPSFSIDLCGYIPYNGVIIFRRIFYV